MVELVHNTAPDRLRQIAEDLQAEGWYTIASTIAQVADEKEEWQQAQNVKQQNELGVAKKGSSRLRSGLTLRTGR